MEMRLLFVAASLGLLFQTARSVSSLPASALTRVDGLDSSQHSREAGKASLQESLVKLRKSYGHSGLEGVAARLRDGLRSSGSSVSRGRDKGTDCVKLQNKGSYFTTKLRVGTPPQDMDVVADTGSDSVVVTSCVCTEDTQACSKESSCFKGTNKSSTFEVEKIAAEGHREGGYRMVQLAFGSGPVSTVIATDVVRVGDTQANMSDSLLLMVDQRLDIDGGFDGILGLGMPQKDLPLPKGHKEDEKIFRAKGFLETAGISKFSVCAQDGGDGFLRLGDESPAPYLGSVGKSHWGVNFHGISIGSKTVPVTFCAAGDKKCVGIPDSGTTLMMAPAEHLISLYAKICDEWPRCVDRYKKKTEGLDEESKKDTGDEDYGGSGSDSDSKSVDSALEQSFQSGNNVDDPALSDGEKWIAKALGTLLKKRRSQEEDVNMLQGEESRKAEAFQAMLVDCDSWGRGDKESGSELLERNGSESSEPGHINLDELPDIFLHVSGEGNKKQALKLSANFYVVETEQPEVHHMTKHLLGVFPINISVPTGKTKKVCMPAFASHSFQMAKDQSLWILGTPLFYRYVVGYDLASEPPSMAFHEGDCGSCDGDGDVSARKDDEEEQAQKPSFASSDHFLDDTRGERRNRAHHRLSRSRYQSLGQDTETDDAAAARAARDRGSRPLQVRGPLRVPDFSTGFEI